jgi:hypothetical protein
VDTIRILVSAGRGPVLINAQRFRAKNGARRVKRGDGTLRIAHEAVYVAAALVGVAGDHSAVVDAGRKSLHARPTRVESRDHSTAAVAHKAVAAGRIIVPTRHTLR